MITIKKRLKSARFVLFPQVFFLERVVFSGQESVFFFPFVSLAIYDACMLRYIPLCIFICVNKNSQYLFFLVLNSQYLLMLNIVYLANDERRDINILIRLVSTINSSFVLYISKSAINLEKKIKNATQIKKKKKQNITDFLLVSTLPHKLRLFKL